MTVEHYIIAVEAINVEEAVDPSTGIPLALGLENVSTIPKPHVDDYLGLFTH